MNKYSNVLLNIIFVLVILNLGLTGLVLVKQMTDHAPAMNDRMEKIEPPAAQALGETVSSMYNLQDYQGLYDLFDAKAKIKISQQQLQKQLKKLFQIFGEIEQSEFVSAEKIAEKGDEFYYNLLFNIRVNEISKRSSKLTLVVVKKAKKVSLYGVRINASLALD
jgi:alcohol dehydrogenase YqhD (iron-dependent ADH family)